MPQCSFSCLVFSELLGSSLVSEINLEKILSHYCSKQCLCFFNSFLSFWYSHYMYVTSFIVVPQFLGILFCFFSCLLFSFESFYGYTLKLSLSSVMFSQSIHKSLKGIFHFFCTVFDLQHFILRIPLCLHCPSVIACYLFHPIEPLAF